jgi:hypothetical protein
MGLPAVSKNKNKTWKQLGVAGEAIEPLRREVREGLLTFLQRNYPEALPGGQARRPSG